jgi:DNA-binding XRE family transcriptional regulator
MISYIIKNVSIFNPESFAEWLNNSFRNSTFKSWADVATRIGTTRSTLSRYAGAKLQTLTGKASQPSPELCIKLAKLFNADIDKVLMLGGHAPQNNNQPQFNPEISQLLTKLRNKLQDRTEDEKEKIENEFKTLLLFLDSKTE